MVPGAVAPRASGWIDNITLRRGAADKEVKMIIDPDYGIE